MSEKSYLEHFTLQELRSELISRGVDAGQVVNYEDSAERINSLEGIYSEQIYQALLVRQLTLYGVDDRRDLHQVTDHLIHQDADGVVAVFDLEMITPSGDGTSRIATRPFGLLHSLCPDELFFDQPGSRCDTGFLVAPQIVLTAGHIQNLPNKLFVFGFAMTSANSPQVFNIPDGQIYHGTKVIKGNSGGPGRDDFALIQLDRAVTDHRCLPIRRSGRISDGQAVHVLGHPRGLPLKFAAGANVTNNANDSFFVANLDTYTGNSGSPVFNSSNHLVEGILVRGGNRDFVPVGYCQKSLVCSVISGNPECSGEECMRVARIAALIP